MSHTLKASAVLVGMLAICAPAMAQQPQDDMPQASTSCDKAPLPFATAADTKTVSWFIAHPTERARVYKACKDDPGDALHSANCYNAAEANDQVSLQSTIDSIDKAMQK